jgi:hypothetical protein
MPKRFAKPPATLKYDELKRSADPILYPHGSYNLSNSFFFFRGQAGKLRVRTDNGFKLHLSVKTGSEKKAFEILFPLLSQLFDTFKLTDLLHEFGARFTNGTQFTNYLFEHLDGQPVIPISVLKAFISQAHSLLKVAGVEPGIIPESDAETFSPYFSLRNAFTLYRKYISARLVGGCHNPANWFNPYVELLKNPPPAFSPIAHYQSLPRETSEDAVRSLKLTLHACVNNRLKLSAPRENFIDCTAEHLLPPFDQNLEATQRYFYQLMTLNNFLESDCFDEGMLSDSEVLLFADDEITQLWQTFKVDQRNQPDEELRRWHDDSVNDYAIDQLVNQVKGMVADQNLPVMTVLDRLSVLINSFRRAPAECFDKMMERILKSLEPFIDEICEWKFGNEKQIFLNRLLKIIPDYPSTADYRAVLFVLSNTAEEELVPATLMRRV